MAESTKDLVEEVYATTVDPARYDELMRCWEDYIEAQVAVGEGRADGVVCDRLLDRHVETALKIFEQIGRSRPPESGADAVLMGLPVAAIIINERCAIVAANTAAKPLLQFKQLPTLADLALDELSESKLRSWMAGQKFQHEPVLLLPCFLGPEAAASCIAVTRVGLSHPLALAGLESDLQGGNHFLLTTGDFYFDQHVGTALGLAYSLSPAEVSVAMALARGDSPGSIAAGRCVSLNTVRTQIKVILRKLGASAIPGLVRIMSGFAASISASRTMTGAYPDRRHTDWHRRKGMLRLRDGRRLAYEDSGPADGRPVLFVHNMLLGPALTDPAIEVAGQKRWRFIAPSRPGFGRSDQPPHGRAWDVIDGFVRDAEELLDHLGIEKALLVGHLSGGVYALRLAERLPERFGALLLVNHVPLYSDRLLISLPARQRAFGLTIRHAPRLLPFIARAGAAHIDAGCEDQLLRTLHGSIPTDMAALNRPEVRRAVIEGLRHAVQQSTAAFCIDCPLVMTDWSARARRVGIPAHLVLGAEDRFVRAEYGRDFVSRCPHFGLTVVEGAGMYLLYTHWPKVFDLLERLGREQAMPLAASA